jgi:hypothetical protein
MRNLFFSFSLSSKKNLTGIRVYLIVSKEISLPLLLIEFPTSRKQDIRVARLEKNIK